MQENSTIRPLTDEEKAEKIEEWGRPVFEELEENLTKQDIQTYLKVCIYTQQEIIKAVNYLLEKSNKE